MKYIEPQTPPSLPSLTSAEVRIVAHTPEAARAVAEALRGCFAGAEQRSYPGRDGGTRLHLTVDTATPAGPTRTWMAASRAPVGTGAHSDET
ncbi:hypothetical protein M8Z33_13915 [Streptomyces sp. ZAF1911]|uniref:hypothetical protein n=1 Tax=unclassified Streptomyces TaxID=2593676 RepID=UPI00237A5E24|nr:hypothetical protein [Streptomyces sp. ZAF1911]MDD9377735.1 hypothetical protein [Streptomyces sp. ZAF1911]